MLIRSFNPTTDDLEKTYLDNPVSAGTTTLTVKNSNNFAANDRVLIGEMGGENSEIVTVSGTATTSLTIGATSFSHAVDTPVYQLRFDQVKFYNSTDSGSNYSVLATVDLDVDNADLETTYDDTTGIASYIYKISLYHSISAVESQLSDPIGGLGYRRDQVGYIVDKVLTDMNDQAESYVTRTELIGLMGDVNDDLTSQVSRPYSFLYTTTDLTPTAQTNYIAYPTDSDSRPTMWKFDRIDINFTDTTTDPDTDITYTLPVLPYEEFRNKYSSNRFDSTDYDDRTVEMALDEASDRFYFAPPFETTTTVPKLYFWKFFDVLDSEGDSIETPTGRIYELYLKKMYCEKRGISDPTFATMASKYETQYEIEKRKYTQHNRRDKGTPRFFRLPTPTTKSYRRGF